MGTEDQKVYPLICHMKTLTMPTQNYQHTTSIRVGIGIEVGIAISCRISIDTDTDADTDPDKKTSFCIP